MDTREPTWPDSADIWARCLAAEAKVARVEAALESWHIDESCPYTIRAFNDDLRAALDGAA